jgi:hypothetical protein
MKTLTGLTFFDDIFYDATEETVAGLENTF